MSAFSSGRADTKPNKFITVTNLLTGHGCLGKYLPKMNPHVDYETRRRKQLITFLNALH